MNKIMNRFFNSFRELSNQPENEVTRTLVRDNANIVIKDFKRISDEITHVKQRMDSQMEAIVADSNALGGTIAKLNKEIVRLENMGGETGDLRDQRDAAVRNLEDTKASNTQNIANAETYHERRYRKLLENIQKKQVFKRNQPEKWKCRNCGLQERSLSS